MKIIVYGIGGVGGYFGGKLAQTDTNVTFIARGSHLKAIKENGLQVKSTYGDFTATPTLVTDTITEAPMPDLVVLAVKSWQLPGVAQELKPVIGKDTLVLPLQNGADNAEKLTATLGEDNVLAGLCRIVSFIEAPGKIYHKAFHPQVLFGELDNTKTERLQKIKEVFDAAGFDNRIPNDIHLEIWRKFLFICMISGIGGLTRVTIGVMRTDPYIRGLIQQTAEEIMAVAQAKGIGLTQTDIETAFNAIDKQAYDNTASMQRDIMEGRPSELDDFNGYIVREGKKHHLSTPVNEFIYQCLLPAEKKARTAVMS